LGSTRKSAGGTNLQAQEIRVAIYRGPILTLLRELNNDTNWRAIYGNRPKRLKDHELVLRFLALYERHGSYSRPMKGFLNDYMGDRTDVSTRQARKLAGVFSATTAAVQQGIGRRAFRPADTLNAAAVDSVMFGVAKRLDNGPITRPKDLASAFERLLANERYRLAIERSTADEESVGTRLSLAAKAFSGVA